MATSSDLERVQRIMQALWPEEEVRHDCASALADSIRFAHSHGSACWEVTLFDDRISLNVGPIQVLTLRQDKVSIYFRGPLRLPKRLGLEIEFEGDQYFYAAIPGPSSLCWVPAHSIERIPSSLREAHWALIADAAIRRRVSTWRKHHSNETLTYIERELGVGIPRPNYDVVASVFIEAVIGGGYGDPEANREVEEAAIKYVENTYRSRGWSVTSVEPEKCGFDLLCRKGRRVARVEVKGSRGDACKFVITAGELRVAHEDQSFVLAWVGNALTGSPRLIEWSAKSFLDAFDFDAIQYWAKCRELGERI